MNKSITQETQNDKQISKSIKRFFISHPESYNPVHQTHLLFFRNVNIKMNTMCFFSFSHIINFFIH